MLIRALSRVNMLAASVTARQILKRGDVLCAAETGLLASVDIRVGQCCQC